MPRGGGRRRPTGKGAMSVEYLLVVYNGDRDVLADGDRVGVTNHTSGQRQLQTAVKNIGTSRSLSPIQLQQAVEAGRVLLRQHPCFQRLLLNLNASTAPVT